MSWVSLHIYCLTYLLITTSIESHHSCFLLHNSYLSRKLRPHILSAWYYILILILIRRCILSTSLDLSLHLPCCIYCSLSPHLSNCSITPLLSKFDSDSACLSQCTSLSTNQTHTTPSLLWLLAAFLRPSPIRISIFLFFLTASQHVTFH
jgi:hypothetical protein